MLLTKCEVKIIGYWILRFYGPWNEEKKRNEHQTSNIKEQTAIDQTLGLVIKRISYMVKTKFLLAEQSGLIRVLTSSCVLGYT